MKNKPPGRAAPIDGQGMAFCNKQLYVSITEKAIEGRKGVAMSMRILILRAGRHRVRISITTELTKPGQVAEGAGTYNINFALAKTGTAGEGRDGQSEPLQHELCTVFIRSLAEAYEARGFKTTVSSRDPRFAELVNA